MAEEARLMAEGRRLYAEEQAYRKLHGMAWAIREREAESEAAWRRAGATAAAESAAGRRARADADAQFWYSRAAEASFDLNELRWDLGYHPVYGLGPQDDGTPGTLPEDRAVNAAHRAIRARERAEKVAAAR